MDYKKGIKRLVAETGLNQKELAAKADIAPATVTSWVAGRVEPKISLISKLLAPRGIKPSTFIGWCEVASQEKQTK